MGMNTTLERSFQAQNLSNTLQMSIGGITLNTNRLLIDIQMVIERFDNTDAN